MELAGIVTIAAYASQLLGEQEAIQPFMADLTEAMQALRRPPPPALTLVDLEVVVDVPPPPPPPVESVWDPEPAEAQMESSRARALLLELIRRAAHDWVLYRTSRRMDQRELAQEAFTWLFEERPGHASWEQRRSEGRELTSFLTICELLELDPDFVRERVRKMTPHGIKMAGRPAENRHRKGVDAPYYVEHGVEIEVEDLESYN